MAGQAGAGAISLEASTPLSGALAALKPHPEASRLGFQARLKDLLRLTVYRRRSLSQDLAAPSAFRERDLWPGARPLKDSVAELSARLTCRLLSRFIQHAQPCSLTEQTSVKCFSSEAILPRNALLERCPGYEPILPVTFQIFAFWKGRSGLDSRPQRS